MTRALRSRRTQRPSPLRHAVRALHTPAQRTAVTPMVPMAARMPPRTAGACTAAAPRTLATAARMAAARARPVRGRDARVTEGADATVVATSAGAGDATPDGASRAVTMGDARR